MAKLSPARAAWPILKGLKLVYRGKVHDVYDLGNGYMLIVATDSISIFDFILNALAPEKGVILNVMRVFSLRYLESRGFRTHLAAYGSRIDDYLPSRHRNNPDLQSRAIVVRKLDIVRVEFIARRVFFKASSSFKSYDIEKGGTICGHWLRPGYQDGDKLDSEIDTPTTKEDDDHDKPVDAAAIRAQYPKPSKILLGAFDLFGRLCHERGILQLDCKLEMDEHGVIGDEGFTPDTCRFVLLNKWDESRIPEIDRVCPEPLDKQLMRAWGIPLGIDKLSPKKPDDVAYVQGLEVPTELPKNLVRVYADGAQVITCKPHEQYLREDMSVAA